MTPVCGRKQHSGAELSVRRRLLIVTFRAIALYGFAAWVYVALVALVEPKTLSWQLTHLSRWPRTDTFGEVSFVVSFAAFWLQGVLRAGGASVPEES